MKKFILYVILIFFISCQTIGKKENIASDFDQMLNNALTLTNRGYYKKSISILQEIENKFPDREYIAIKYNLGFNYYKLNNFDEAKKNFKLVINYFEELKDSVLIEENRKFVVLSEIILNKIEKLPELKKDPYHIKEDLEGAKQKKAKTKQK